MWHLSPDTWQVTRDIQGVVNNVSKFQVPTSYGFVVKVFWRYFHNGWLSVTKVFVEQSRLHRVFKIVYKREPAVHFLTDPV